MARYRINTTKYLLKWPKNHQKVPKFNKKPYPHCPPPPGLIHILEIINIHNKAKKQGLLYLESKYLVLRFV